MAQEYNDSLDDQPEFERVEGLQGGMDAYTRATLLPQNTAQLLENIIIDTNGSAKTRPGADALGTIPETGIIQGMAYYDTPSIEQLVVAKNAKILSWDNANWSTVAGYTPNSASLSMEITQGFDLVYLSDGVANWRSYNGSTFTDLGSVVGQQGDPPKGATIMAWHGQRMWASGVSSAYDTVWVSDLLSAGSGHWDHTSYSFRVGKGEGEPVRAMCGLMDNQIACFKANSVWLVDAPPTVNASLYTITRLAIGVGCVGKRALVQFGNDILFMSRDGVRSLARMENVGGQYEVSPPISQPLQPYIDRINWTYASTICAAKYRHFIFFAIPIDSDTRPTTTLVYNVRTASWMGVWTGWTPLQFVVTRFLDLERLVVGDNSGNTNQWKDYLSESLSSTYTDNSVNIATTIKLRAFSFGEPVNYKDGRYLEARFTDSQGVALLSVYYDDTLAKAETRTLQQTVNQLPLVLPFDLAVIKPSAQRVALDEAGTFNEAYLQITASANKFSLRNATMAAYMNTVINE